MVSIPVTKNVGAIPTERKRNSKRDRSSGLQLGLLENTAKRPSLTIFSNAHHEKTSDYYGCTKGTISILHLGTFSSI